jgi:hypothetical protein
MVFSPMATDSRPLCHLCETRKPKRECPGVNAAICPQCCGKEREETIHCPMTCEFLKEARHHERAPAMDPDLFPNKDVRVSEEFVQEHEELFTIVSVSLIQAVLKTPGAVDNDIRECLEAVIKTYRTADSGLIYETKPVNRIAADIQQHFTNSIAEFKKFVLERTGTQTIRDSEVLSTLAFLQRLELTSNNGRRYGRAFFDSLRSAFPVEPANLAPEVVAPSSSLIL